MPRQKIHFYCILCNKDFKHDNIFGPDLHIRRLHGGKIVDDAVKNYIEIIFDDFQNNILPEQQAQQEII